jgi:hypothetical protein
VENGEGIVESSRLLIHSWISPCRVAWSVLSHTASNL